VTVWNLADDTAETELVSIQPKMLHEAVVGAALAHGSSRARSPRARASTSACCATRLGVSRTPLREAFPGARGPEAWSRVLPNRGAVVPELDAADIAETFEVIAGLEAMSGELACARVTDDEVNEIRALHYEMLACHAVRDLPGYYRLNHQIHDAINRAARNGVLRQMYTNINSRLQALRFRSNFDRDKWDAAVREHSSMIEALDARDGPRLGTILRAHVLKKCACVLAQRALANEARAIESSTGTRHNPLRCSRDCAYTSFCIPKARMFQLDSHPSGRHFLQIPGLRTSPTASCGQWTIRRSTTGAPSSRSSPSRSWRA
jgi:DNA-binding GntR family transcriptional regulator